MRGLIVIAMAALGALGALAAGVAQAGETTHPSGVVQATEVERDNGVLEVYQSVRSPAGAPAPFYNRLLFRLPRGAEPRFSRFARCQVARLQAHGPKGCPRGSRVGRGIAIGSYRQSAVSAELRLHNGERLGNRRTLLVHTEPASGPAFVSIGKWLKRTGGSIDLDLQLGVITTYQQYGDFSSYELSFDARRARIRFLTSLCDGRWSVTGFLPTGAVITSADATACR